MSLADRVRDVLDHKAKRHPKVDVPLHERVNEMAAGLPVSTPLVDATVIYKTYGQRSGIAIYEDHPCIRAPWPEAWVGYVNEHGNEMVTLVQELPSEDVGLWQSGAGNDLSAATSALWCWTWVGGRSSQGEKIPTFGPFMLTQIAVDEHGTPLDIHWVDISYGTETDQSTDWPRWTVLGAYNLLNCRNTTLVSAPMDRAARRRQARLGGVVESVIHIDSRGPSRASKPGADGTSVALERLHSVRGHVAHYGACCPHHEPAGLLFGRITGRVWVPQHARGGAEAGATRQTFILKEDA